MGELKEGDIVNREYPSPEDNVNGEAIFKTGQLISSDIEIIESSLNVIRLTLEKNINDYSTEGAVKAAWKAIAGTLLKYEKPKETE